MLDRATVALRLVSIAVLALVGLRLTAQAPAPYSFATISYPGSSSTTASGIDIAGRVVGSYVDAGGATHGFLLNNGDYINLDYPGAMWTAAFGLNNGGQIVGGSGPNATTGRRGFVSNGATYSSLQVPGSVDTIARAINSRGEIVGDYARADGVRHGFLLSAGTYTTIEMAGRNGAAAHGINDSGQVVGAAGPGTTSIGFLFAAGRYTPIQPSGSSYAIAYGVNHRGEIVGQVRGPQPPVQGFRRTGSDIQTLAAPGGAVSWDARGINDRGEIVGTMTDRDGRTVGYRATPATTPSGPATPSDTTSIAAPAGGRSAAAAPVPPVRPATTTVVSTAGRLREIVVVDRAGTVILRKTETTPINIVSISPDGRRVAYSPGGNRIMALDVASGTLTQIGQGTSPVGWSPDGSRITHLDRREGVLAIYVTSSTGSGGEERILTSPNGIYHWTGDGRHVVAGLDDTFVAIPVAPGARTPLVVLSQLQGSGPRISPDNRFIAFTSDDGAARATSVRPLTLGRDATTEVAQWRVSSGDALGMNRWRGDSRELYYIASDGSVMAVPIGAGAAFTSGAPVRLFRAPAAFPLDRIVGQHADVSSDGQRFVFLLATAD